MPNLGLGTNVTPTTGVAPGKIVPLGGSVFGVADRGGVANSPMAVDLTPGRVRPVPKPTGTGTNYAQFATVYLFPATLDGQAVTGVTGIKLGIVASQPATTDTTVDVLLFPGCGL